MIAAGVEEEQAKKVLTYLDEASDFVKKESISGSYTDWLNKTGCIKAIEFDVQDIVY